MTNTRPLCGCMGTVCHPDERDSGHKHGCRVEQGVFVQRWARLAVCSTMCALFGGLAVLLLFIHYFCVPHMLTATFSLSSCHVTQLSHVTNLSNNSALSDCIQLQVALTDLQGHKHHSYDVYQSSWTYYQVLYGPLKVRHPVK